jgi:hypothetical protein
MAEGMGSELYSQRIETEIDEEASNSKAPMVEDYIPARLSVVRKKQHATACQYWLKLENRLPFMIRNLALRFSTYLKSNNYNRPVLFDSDVRSFSRLRPTDTQYRDIFYEDVECDDLSFIRVEDAGRCALGGLTKFSAQIGDCAKYVEVEPSDIICIFLDDQPVDVSDTEVEGQVIMERETEQNPCWSATQRDVDD